MSVFYLYNHWTKCICQKKYFFVALNQKKDGRWYMTHKNINNWLTLNDETLVYGNTYERTSTISKEKLSLYSFSNKIKKIQLLTAMYTS